MRKFIIALILFLGIIYIYARLSEIGVILSTLQKGDWRFLLLAGVIQGLWQLNIAKSYQVLYADMGIKEDLKTLVPLIATVNSTNIVAPTVGMSGIAILMDQARRKGYSTAKAAVVNTLFVEFDYLGFLIILAVGLFVLFRRENLQSAEIIASVILFSLACLMALLLYQGTLSTTALEKSLVWMARLVNKILRPFIHRDYLSEERAHTFSKEAHVGLYIFRKEPRKILPPILLGFSNKMLLMLNLLVMFLAFDVPVSPGTVVAGFSIGYLFYIVSPTPAGLGIVEGVLSLALKSMYIPLGTAVVLTIAYRAFTFWLPLVFGLLCLRRTGSQKNKQIIGES